MATRLADLDALFEPGLELTVRGKDYTVPLASAELGMWCRRMAIATGEVTAASSEEEIRAAVDRINDVPPLPGDLTLPERTLGPVYQQMADDNVPDAWITYCGVTAYIWIISDEATAAKWWASGGRPEAQRPANNRAERRAAARNGGTGGAAASGTRTPASTSGTRSRRRSGRRRASG